MASIRTPRSTVSPAWPTLAHRLGRVVAVSFILSQSLLLISNASTVGVELGENDFRISDMGPNGYDWATAANPAIAYNSTNKEYLVVWQGDDVHDDCVEIMGQRIDAMTGAELGSDFRISDMGGSENDDSFGAQNPDVAYSATENEYLVVWSGDDSTDGEFEIYGQLLDATDGSEVGANDFRISDMGNTDGDTTFGATVPAVAYDSTDNEYLVVWQGDDETPGDGDVEIFGQRIDATNGGELGTNDFRISDMGTSDDPTFDAGDPAIAYNPLDNEYLVVWYGDDDTGSLVDAEFEIYGQRIDASDGSEIGSDFRISNVGADGDRWMGAYNPAVAYNSVEHDYLVVWAGEVGALTNQMFEIYGQRLDATTCAEIGSNDFRISDMGASDTDADYDAEVPAVIHSRADNEYLVVWYGDDDISPLANNEFEIFGQRLDGATCAEVGDNDFRVSDMGNDGDGAFEARDPAVAYAVAANQYLVTWQGDEYLSSPVVSEFEIFGQRIMLPTLRYYAWD